MIEFITFPDASILVVDDPSLHWPSVLHSYATGLVGVMVGIVLLNACCGMPARKLVVQTPQEEGDGGQWFPYFLTILVGMWVLTLSLIYLPYIFQYTHTALSPQGGVMCMAGTFVGVSLLFSRLKTFRGYWLKASKTVRTLQISLLFLFSVSCVFQARFWEHPAGPFPSPSFWHALGIGFLFAIVQSRLWTSSDATA